MDWDKNGVVSPIEFKSYLANLKKGEELNSEEVYSAFDKIDADGSKQIQWEEFLVSRAVACVIKPRCNSHMVASVLAVASVVIDTKDYIDSGFGARGSYRS